MTFEQLMKHELAKLKSQEERLQFWFDNIATEINPLQAWEVLGIYRLAAVVHKMKTKGADIITINTDVSNQFGEKCSVATYKNLKAKPPVQKNVPRPKKGIAGLPIKPAGQERQEVQLQLQGL